MHSRHITVSESTSHGTYSVKSYLYNVSILVRATILMRVLSLSTHFPLICYTNVLFSVYNMFLNSLFTYFYNISTVIQHGKGVICAQTGMLGVEGDE